MSTQNMHGKNTGTQNKRIDNPKLGILKVIGGRYRVIAYGSNSVWGENKAYLLVHGQPVIGLNWREALQLAERTTPEILAKLCEGKTGSYLSKLLREQLTDFPGAVGLVEEREKLLAERERLLSEKHIVPVTPPRTPIVTPTPTRIVEVEQPSRAVSLLERRRSIMKQLAQLDRDLSEILGQEVAAVIREGMARPLTNGGVDDARRTENVAQH